MVDYKLLNMIITNKYFTDQIFHGHMFIHSNDMMFIILSQKVINSVPNSGTVEMLISINKKLLKIGI